MRSPRGQQVSHFTGWLATWPLALLLLTAPAHSGGDTAQAQIRVRLAPEHRVTPRGDLFIEAGTQRRGELVVQCAPGERYQVVAPQHLRHEGPAAAPDGGFDCDARQQLHRFEVAPGVSVSAPAGAQAVSVTFF